MNNDIKKAIEILKQGGIIIYPTDTAFGIGCRVDFINSVKRLFKLRKRPTSQPMPVLVSNVSMAREYASIPLGVEEKLIKKYWPGALTIILNSKNGKINELISGGTKTVGIRVPKSDKILTVIRGLGVPITGSSANFHGEQTPYKLEELNPKLVKMVDFVLKGECIEGMSSTVIDTTVFPWKILRNGAIDIKMNL